MSWDVRTKHVTYDKIPTLEHIKGLAVYGPGASLFTLGANNTVQQFDLNAPAVMVANVQHPANLLPPSPPVSIEEQEKAAGTASDSEMVPFKSVQIYLRATMTLPLQSLESPERARYICLPTRTSIEQQAQRLVEVGPPRYPRLVHELQVAIKGRFDHVD